MKIRFEEMMRVVFREFYAAPTELVESRGVGSTNRTLQRSLGMDARQRVPTNATDACCGRSADFSPLRGAKSEAGGNFLASWCLQHLSGLKSALRGTGDWKVAEPARWKVGATVGRGAIGRALKGLAFCRQECRRYGRQECLRYVAGVVAMVLVFGQLQARAEVAGAQDAGSNVLSVDYVISEVLSNNAGLKAARAGWEAMKERVPQARAWEDPRAGVDVTAGRFVGVPPNSFADQKFSVEQRLPISGQNRLQGDAANAEAFAAFEEFQQRKLDAMAQARVAYYRLADAYAQRELNEKNATLLKQYAEISRAKFAVGTRFEADVLSAETEAARLEETTSDFERAISDAQTKLNLLMNRRPESPLGAPAPLAFHPRPLVLEEVEALALAHRPALLIAQRKIEAAEARLEASHRGWVPEPSVRVETDRYNGSSQVMSEVMVGFSVNLPWFNRSKYRAAIHENEKLVESAREELVEVRLETLGKVRDQLRKIQTLHHHAELSQSKLFLLAEQTISAKRRAYETDKTSLLELVMAQQTAREIEVMYWDHIADYQAALAELEALVGGALEEQHEGGLK